MAGQSCLGGSIRRRISPHIPLLRLTHVIADGHICRDFADCVCSLTGIWPFTNLPRDACIRPPPPQLLPQRQPHLPHHVGAIRNQPHPRQDPWNHILHRQEFRRLRGLRELCRYSSAEDMLRVAAVCIDDHCCPCSASALRFRMCRTRPIDVDVTIPQAWPSGSATSLMMPPSCFCRLCGGGTLSAG